MAVIHLIYLLYTQLRYFLIQLLFYFITKQFILTRNYMVFNTVE